MLWNEAMAYQAMVISAHPDDAEVQMGGTIAKLAELGVRVAQAQHAASIRGAERIFLEGQDRFVDAMVARTYVYRFCRSML
jgi:hypothetical protein